MLEPNGPLPPEIYRRRRALAIGAVAVAVLLLIWLISSLGGPGESPETDPVAESSSLTTPLSISASASNSGTSNSDSSGGGSGDQGGGGGGTAASSDSSGTSGASTTASTSSQPVPPGQCPDQSLAIKVNADKPTYLAGEEPGFTIVITNIGTNPCERDLGGGLQQVLVYTLDGNQRLWSNIDCYPQAAPDLRTLAPGEQAAFTVKWSGTTSAPDCATQQVPRRDPVGPGAYTAVGQLGQLRSAPEPFNLG